MKKTALVLTASALSLAMSGAFAAGAEPRAGAGTGMDQQAQIDPATSYRVSDLMDIDVKNAQDQDLGTVSELIVDKDGKISHVVLQESGTLGVGENKYAVPWDRVSIQSLDDVLIDVNPDNLSSEFAAFDEQQFEDAASMQQRPEESGTPGDTGSGSGSY